MTDSSYAATPAQPVVAELWTDVSGRIINATPAVQQVLGVAHTHIPGRNLVLFFLENRHTLIRVLEEASRGHVFRFSAQLRPRERSPVHVDVLVDRGESPRRVRLQWTLAVTAPGTAYSLIDAFREYGEDQADRGEAPGPPVS